MRVHELIESEWENDPPVMWKDDDRDQKERINRRRKALRNQDDILYFRLQHLEGEHPQDIFVGAFPSQYDDKHGVFVGPPAVVHKDPTAFVEIPLTHLWYFEDELRHGEGYDDAHEKYYVRKSKTNLVSLVKNIIERHNKVRQLMTNPHFWLYK